MDSLKVYDILPIYTFKINMLFTFRLSEFDLPCAGTGDMPYAPLVCTATGVSTVLTIFKFHLTEPPGNTHIRQVTAL